VFNQLPLYYEIGIARGSFCVSVIIEKGNEAMIKKLRSGKGASITFALLLFLVCSVVGTVVLTAGTAAAGRIADIKEYDQRYYSASSAAELLINLIDGQSVTVVRTQTATSTTTVTSVETTDSEGNKTLSVNTSTTGPYYSYSAGFSDGVSSTGKDLLHDSAYLLACGSLTPTLSDIWSSDGIILSSSVSEVLKMNHPDSVSVDGTSVDLGDLDISIDKTLSTDGDLTFTISSSDSNAYTLKLVFTADVENTSGNPVTTTSGSSDNYTETTVTTKTTAVTWTFSTLKAVSN